MSPRLNTCRPARRELKDGERILSVQGWINIQRIDDVALTGVESMLVKDDHLCYHSAQKQGSSNFVYFRGSDRGSQGMYVIISFQINSISSFF